MIKEACKATRQALVATLPAAVKVKLSPSVNMVDVNDNVGRNDIILTLEGPEIAMYKHNFRVDRVYKDTVAGVDRYDLKNWRAEIDLVWRARIFAGTLLNAIGTVEELLKASGTLTEVTITGLPGGDQVKPLIIGRDFLPDTAPNLANIKEYAGEIRCEEIEVRPDNADETVFEVIKLMLDTYKN